MIKMLHFVAVAGGVLAMAATSVTGSWSMLVKGSPHGDVQMGLVLKQAGTTVTGTFATPHGEVPVAGTFADGKLDLASSGKDENAPQLTLTARLKDDDTLSGYLSSAMGDMTWTATRERERK